MRGRLQCFNGWMGWDGMYGWMGCMGWMVIIGLRSSKSTYGANEHRYFSSMTDNRMIVSSIFVVFLHTIVNIAEYSQACWNLIQIYWIIDWLLCSGSNIFTNISCSDDDRKCSCSYRWTLGSFLRQRPPPSPTFQGVTFKRESNVYKGSSKKIGKI